MEYILFAIPIIGLLAIAIWGLFFSSSSTPFEKWAEDNEEQLGKSLKKWDDSHDEVLRHIRNMPSQKEKDKKLAKINNRTKQSIIKLLKEKGVKMPASDIDAHLKHKNVDEIKEFCEEMYHNGEISRTGNYRYFVLTEEKKKPKKASSPKSEAVDVKAELKKYKEMLEEGLITQEVYDSKMNQLLGL